MTCDALVLFCGGPPIYVGDVPKPLQPAGDGLTLLERYLRHIQSEAPGRIVLLCDETFADRYREVVGGLVHPSKIEVFVGEDNSTTLNKMRLFLASGFPADRLVQFSYPDLFYWGDLALPDAADDPQLDDKILVSITPLTSRFPRLTVDPYSGSVRGISNHSSLIPANPMHIFGGHLVARAGVLKEMTDAFVQEAKIAAPSLEYDLFFWLINRSKVSALTLYGQWMQIDSPRDLAHLAARL
jgi:NDP-sugar pyrophosphorylase family protein